MLHSGCLFLISLFGGGAISLDLFFKMLLEKLGLEIAFWHSSNVLVLLTHRVKQFEIEMVLEHTFDYPNSALDLETLAARR